MRANVYSQEISSETVVVVKTSENNVPFSGVRIYLHSSARLHNRPDDDDRSAITFWLPRSPARRLSVANTFLRMALDTLSAPKESGGQDESEEDTSDCDSGVKEMMRLLRAVAVRLPSILEK